MSKKPMDRPNAIEMLKRLNEVIKKEPGISLTATEEEATSSTNEGFLSKQTKAPIKGLIPVSQSPYKKPIDKNPPINTVKVIDKDIFKYQMKSKPIEIPVKEKDIKIEPKQIVQIEKPPEKIVTVINDASINVIITESKHKKVNSSVESNIKPVHLPEIHQELKHENQLMSANNILPNQSKKTNFYNDPIPDKVRTINKPLIFSCKKQETNFQRPTLTMFHNMGVDSEDVFKHPKPSRPTTAIVRSAALVQEPGQKYSKPEVIRDNISRPNIWERPQSAMPIGNASIVSRPNCQT